MPDGTVPQGTGKGKKGKGKAAAKPKGKGKAKARGGKAADGGDPANSELALVDGRDRVKARKFFAMLESLPQPIRERYEARHHVTSTFVQSY